MPVEITPGEKPGTLDIQVQTGTETRTLTVSLDEFVDLDEAVDEAGCRYLEKYNRPDDWEMFDTAGNREVQNMFDTVTAAIKNGQSEDEARSYLDTEMDRIAGTHPEIWDTAVREALMEELGTPWSEAFGEELSF